MGKITLKWLGHASYKLTFDDWSAVLDPYRDGSVEGLGNLREKANMVLCSHGHHDHNAEELVEVTEKEGAPAIIRVDSFHDNEGGEKRGPNAITVFEYDGIRIGHFGDLGHKLTDRQLEEIGKLDLAMLPVGGFFTIDAATAKEVARQLGAKTIVPMHYRMENFGFEVLSTLDAFTSLFDDVTYANASEIVVDENTPRGVLVLTPALAGK